MEKVEFLAREQLQLSVLRKMVVMAKSKKKVSEAQDLVDMCDDALLRKLGMENIKFSKMCMEELVRREQKNISK